MGTLATTAYKRLASQITWKKNQPYNKVMAWLCCHLCFSLLRSSITAIREARSGDGHAARAMQWTLLSTKGRCKYKTLSSYIYRARTRHFIITSNHYIYASVTPNNRPICIGLYKPEWLGRLIPIRCASQNTETVIQMFGNLRLPSSVNN